MQWLRRAFVTIKGLPLGEQNDNQLLSTVARAVRAAHRCCWLRPAFVFQLKSWHQEKSSYHQASKVDGSERRRRRISHAVASGNWPRVLPAHFTSWRSLPVFAGVTIWIMAPCVFFLGSLFIARHIILAPRLILPVQWSTTMFGWIRQLSEKWAVFPLTRSPLLAELLERLSNLFELILINAWRWRRLRPDACKR